VKSQTNIVVVKILSISSNILTLCYCCSYSVRLVESSNTQLLVCANPKNIFLPIDADQLYVESTDGSPAKRQKLDGNGAAAAAAASASSSVGASAAAVVPTATGEIYVPQRLIRGMVAHHYEVSEILPRLHVLRELLMKNLYIGDEEEAAAWEEEQRAIAEEQSEQAEAKSNGDGKQPKRKRERVKRYDLATLRSLIQASDAQLSEGLSALEAFEDSRGHWRMLHPDLRAKILDSILTYTQERSWNRLTDLPPDECGEGLKELYEPRVTKHVLKSFSKKQLPEADQNCECNVDQPTLY
jgi:hypothetical protein